MLFTKETQDIEWSSSTTHFSFLLASSNGFFGVFFYSSSSFSSSISGGNDDIDVVVTRGPIVLPSPSVLTTTSRCCCSWRCNFRTSRNASNALLFLDIAFLLLEQLLTRPPKGTVVVFGALITVPTHRQGDVTFSPPPSFVRSFVRSFSLPLFIALMVVVVCLCCVLF